MKLLKAYEYFNRMNKEDNILARKEVEEAIALDPEYSLLYSWLALTHIVDLWVQSRELREIHFAQASKNIKKALALDEDNWHAYFVLSQYYLLRKEYDKAFSALEPAIAMNPNGADAYAYLGIYFSAIGKPEQGINLIRKAIRLNPIPRSRECL
jgi:adenylate cyclase